MSSVETVYRFHLSNPNRPENHIAYKHWLPHLQQDRYSGVGRKGASAGMCRNVQPPGSHFRFPRLFFPPNLTWFLLRKYRFSLVGLERRFVGRLSDVVCRHRWSKPYRLSQPRTDVHFFFLCFKIATASSTEILDWASASRGSTSSSDVMGDSFRLLRRLSIFAFIVG